MAKTTTKKKVTPPSNRWLEPLWLAVGVGALAGDSASEFWQRARTRGYELKPVVRRRLVDTRHNAEDKVRQLPSSLKQVARPRLAERFLHLFRLPARSDLDRLETKLDALAKKVA